MSPNARHPFTWVTRFVQWVGLNGVYRKTVNDLANDYPAYYKLSDDVKIIDAISEMNLPSLVLISIIFKMYNGICTSLRLCVEFRIFLIGNIYWEALNGHSYLCSEYRNARLIRVLACYFKYKVFEVARYEVEQLQRAGKRYADAGEGFGGAWRRHRL